MIIYRIGDELFLQDGNPDTEDNVPYLIYDGSYGRPHKFFFFLKTFRKQRRSYTIFYVVISMPGSVLVNAGTIFQLKLSTWYEHQTDRNDEPIDFNIEDNIEDQQEYPSLRFLYSDLTFTVIQFLEGDEFDVFHQDDLSTITFDQGISLDQIQLPISKVYNRYNSFSMIREAGRGGIYNINVMNRTNLYLWKLSEMEGVDEESTEDNRLIDMISTRTNLYSNGDLSYGGMLIEGVVKAKFDVILRDDKILQFIRKDGDQITTILEIGNVGNFYIYRRSSIIYIVKDDQLLSSTLGNIKRDWNVLLEDGASNIRFTTESYYDEQLAIVFSQVKSARKR